MEKRELWKERIAKQRLSGQTQKQWCDEQGFTVSRLRYWINRLKKDGIEAGENLHESSEEALSFAGIIIASEDAQEKSKVRRDQRRDTIEIKIDDMICSVFTEFSEDHLLRVIHVLRKACC